MIAIEKLKLSKLIRLIELQRSIELEQRNDLTLFKRAVTHEGASCGLNSKRELESKYWFCSIIQHAT